MRARLLLVLLLLGCSGPGEQADWSVLVFSRTAGFRHDSIPAGIDCVQRLGRQHGFQVEATEDPAAFTEEQLARFAAVIFLNTTGDVLDEAQQAAFESYIAAGGGYLGVHAASDTEYDWPWYGSLVGAWFRGHPPVQQATIRVADAAHPATRHLPVEWVRTDEWYDFRAQPPPSARRLLELDESSYEGGGMDGDHPIAWCRRLGAGRAFYTGCGHTAASYREPAMEQHMAGAILWAAGRAGD